MRKRKVNHKLPEIRWSVHYFNSIAEELNVPTDQNLLNDASIFGDTFDKTNYIPNSILPVLSKAFKRCLKVH